MAITTSAGRPPNAVVCELISTSNTVSSRFWWCHGPERVKPSETFLTAAIRLATSPGGRMSAIVIDASSWRDHP